MPRAFFLQQQSCSYSDRRDGLSHSWRRRSFIQMGVDCTQLLIVEPTNFCAHEMTG